MFRSVEGVYKANRSFQAKLKEIGPNPSSPRAIGDLLMTWVCNSLFDLFPGDLIAVIEG